MASITSQRVNQYSWLPVLFGLAVICMESTNGMGAGQTAVWLSELVHWTGHQGSFVAELNHILRKSGHFTGYGLLGLCFTRGWLSLLRRRIGASWSGLRLRAGACGIASTFIVASCDEIHQVFLPTRGASFHDVLLDTSGALVLNVVLFGVVMARRRSLLHPVSPFTTLGLSLAAVPARVSTSPNVQRLVRRSSDRVAALHRRLNNGRLSRTPGRFATR